MTSKEQLPEILDPLGIEYEIFACDPALADTAEFCDHYGFSPDDAANTIVVIGKSDPAVYVACVVLAPYRLDVNKAVRTKLGTKKASFADAAVTEAITGMIVGGVTPIGLPADMALWIDSRVMERERIVVGGGSRDCKVLGSPKLLAALPNAEVVVDLAIERPIV